jgi:hypothetical protein
LGWDESARLRRGGVERFLQSGEYQRQISHDLIITESEDCQIAAFEYVVTISVFLYLSVMYRSVQLYDQACA